MANIKAESNTSGEILLTSQKLRDTLTDVFANLSVESLLNLRLTNKHLKTAVDNFVIQTLKQEVPGELESLGENTITGIDLHLYTNLIECKEYFSKLSNSDSDKILKIHCLAYLICRYPSNTKTKDYFIENGADLKAAEKLLQSLKAQKDLNLYLENTFTWGSLYLLKTILLLGADFGDALISQAEAGKTERVKLLLAADKQTEAVNTKDLNGWTALMVAARQEHTEVVIALLAHSKINVNDKDEYLRTALMWAARFGHTEAIQALLAHNKIDVNTKDDNDWTALIRATLNGHIEAIQALLEHDKIEVNAKDKHGWTALMLAVYDGHTEVVKALLAHNNIDVNAKDNNGETALMHAAYKRQTEIVQELLAHNEIDVNATDNDGKTAVILAAWYGYTEIVQAMLAHDKINVNATGSDGKTVLSLAIENRRTEVVNLLKTHIANKAQESQIKTQNTKNSVTKKSLFSGALTASLFAAIAATISFGLKLPVFTILGGPLVLIALAAVAGFIVGAGLAVAITAYSNKNAMVESTDNRTHRESTPKASSNNTVINGFSAGKNVATGVANGQIQNTEQRSFLGCNIV